MRPGNAVEYHPFEMHQFVLGSHGLGAVSDGADGKAAPDHHQDLGDDHSSSLKRTQSKVVVMLSTYHVSTSARHDARISTDVTKYIAMSNVLCAGDEELESDWS